MCPSMETHRYRMYAYICTYITHTQYKFTRRSMSGWTSMRHDQHRLLANGVAISLMLPYTDSQSCNLFALIFIDTFTHYLIHTHV
jgi:hypothetical protein